MMLDVGEDRKRKAAERVKRASVAPTSLFGCASSTYTPLHPLAPPCTPLHALARPCIPLRPFTTSSQPLATPPDPVRSLSPPYRHRPGLDCVALEQAIGEGHAAALPPAELVAAEAVLEKARAAEKVKCEKDLREKMKARYLPVAILTMPIRTSHGRRAPVLPVTLPAHPLRPSLHPLRPSLHPQWRPRTLATPP